MKIRRGHKVALIMLVNAAMLMGTASPSAYAATTTTSAAPIYGWPAIHSETTSDLETVTKGVTYQKIHYDTDNGPVELYETWVNLDDPNVKLKTVLSQDKLESHNNETVSQMASRTGAVAGVNGDFFEQGYSGMALGMNVQNGQLLHTPTQSAVLGIDANNNITIGKFAFSGGVTAANGQAHGIAALNGHLTTFSNSLTLMTPEIGYWESATNATVVSLVPVNGDQYKIVAIDTGKNVVESPYVGSVKLVAQGTEPLAFVKNNLHQGDLVQVDYNTNPSYNNLQYAIGGGPILLKNGQAYNDPNPPLGVRASQTYQGPLTGVGVTPDGKQMLIVAVDGRTSNSIGLTYGQMTNYFAMRGISDAMLLDGGGSTDMVARNPGDTSVSVQNNPSDGVERQVAEGLFVYSTSQPGQAIHVVLNDDQPVTLFKGMTTKLTSYVRDENFNPLPSEKLTYSVQPSTLGTVSADGTFTASDTGGTGSIVATAADGARDTIPLTVYDTVDSLSISPGTLDLGNGETQQFSVQGTVNGQTIDVQPQYLTWTSSNPSLGTVNAQGLFTAATGTGKGTVQVTAAIGGKSASATIGVGYVQKPLQSMSDASLWTLSTRWGPVGSLSTSSAQKEGQNGSSLAVNYNLPAGSGYKQLVFYPKNTLAIPAASDNAAVNPIGIGMWIYGDNSGLSFAASFAKQDGSSVAATNTVTVNWTGWKYVTFKFRSNVTFPLTLDYLDFLIESPSQNRSGTLYLNDLQTIYAARNYAEKPPAPAPKPAIVTFPDIQNHWGRTYVETLATKGIISGEDKTHFAPDKGLNRAEAATLIVRALNLPTTGTSKAFSDVSSNDWFAGAVAAAYNAGIVSGKAPGVFAPNDPVDRDQMAVMIYNAMKKLAKSPTGGTPMKFQDADQIASWALSDVNALSASGLMVGNNGLLHPTDTASRAEAAILLYNMMKNTGLL